MTRIAHLSDLHFGFHRAALVGPLLERINRARVDLVVVTGDLTHRGRPGQFRDAAGFLDRIQVPVMTVPGNHDLPLHTVPMRFLRPLAGYRQAIAPDPAPVRAVGEVRVLGLDSADPFAWERGVIREGQISRILASLDPLATNIVALHHPLQQMPMVDKQLARRAPEALRRFEAAGVRLVLSGHLHRWAAAGLLDLGHPGVLQVQAGTALCARIDDPPNEFAVLQIEGDDLMIERHIAALPRPEFLPPRRSHFSRAGGVWRALDQAGPVPMLPGATDTAFSTA